MQQKVAVVTGAASGLGKLISQKLTAEGFNVVPIDTQFGHDITQPTILNMPVLGRVDVLVNCAGINKINWMADVTHREFMRVIEVNAYGMFAMTQHYRTALEATKGSVCNIVSNAAHMPMRCSAAYNASKGAALILTKQMARELIEDGITIFSVSPNKLGGTGMSEDIDAQVCKTRGWTPEEAHKYQVAGLLTKKETSAAACAEFIVFLLSEKYRHEALAGCDLPYGA